MSFICHIHNYTEYNEEWNVFPAFNPSLEQWAANYAAPGEQSWTSCQSRDSNPQPWVTSGFKSNALSIRPRLPIRPRQGPSPSIGQFGWTTSSWKSPNFFHLSITEATVLFVAFPRSVSQYNPVSELCTQYLWPKGLVPLWFALSAFYREVCVFPNHIQSI